MVERPRDMGGDKGGKAAQSWKGEDEWKGGKGDKWQSQDAVRRDEWSGDRNKSEGEQWGKGDRWQERPKDEWQARDQSWNAKEWPSNKPDQSWSANSEWQTNKPREEIWKAKGEAQQGKQTWDASADSGKQGGNYTNWR